MADFADIDVRLALWRLRPTSAYRWIGTLGDKGYTALAEAVSEWRDANTTMPTEAELITAWEAYQAEQTAAASASRSAAADVRALRLADSALTQISEDRATLAADLAALAGATTAQRWEIVGRAFVILSRSLNREEAEIKALVRLARRYLDEE